VGQVSHMHSHGFHLTHIRSTCCGLQVATVGPLLDPWADTVLVCLRYLQEVQQTKWKMEKQCHSATMWGMMESFMEAGEGNEARQCNQLNKLSPLRKDAKENYAVSLASSPFTIIKWGCLSYKTTL